MRHAKQLLIVVVRGPPAARQYVADQRDGGVVVEVF